MVHNEQRPIEKSSRQSTKRLALNLAGTLASVCSSFMLGVWYTPYLVRHLGTEAFGLISLVTAMTGYLSLLTLSLTHSLLRFLTIASARKDYGEASRVFNTAFFAAAGLILSLLPGIAWVAWHFTSIAAIPPGMESDVSLLFVGSVSGFLLLILISPYNIATFSENRLDLRTFGDILYNVLRVASVVIFFAVQPPRLWHVGAGLLLASVAGAYYAIHWSRRLLPYLALRWRDFDFSTLRALVTTSGWIIVDHLGGILTTGISLLLINRFLGPQGGGEYAIALQWASIVRALGGGLSSVLAPTIMRHFAHNNLDDLVANSLSGIRLTGFALAAPTGIICGFGKHILTCWIGPEQSHLGPLMWIVVIPLAPILAVTPLLYLLTAANAVRLPAVATVLQGLGSVAMIMVTVRILGWGLHGVAWSTLVATVGRNLVFLPLYAARSLDRDAASLFHAVFRVCAATGLCGLIAWSIARFVPLNSWLYLGLGAGTTAIVLLAGIVSLGLTQQERSWAYRLAGDLLPSFGR